jgi:hypothetical protein
MLLRDVAFCHARDFFAAAATACCSTAPEPKRVRVG